MIWILVGDLLIHIEEVSIPGPDRLFTQALDRIGEIEVDRQAGLPDAAAFVTDGFRVPRRMPRC